MKKIFIIGNGHSGTSILYKMLAFHPDLSWFCQYSQRSKRTIPWRILFPFSNIIKNYLKKKKTFSWEKGQNSLLFPRPGEMNSLWKYLWSINDLKLRAEILNLIIDDEIQSWGKSSIIIKNPWIGKHVELINNMLPDDVYFIHIVRDSRAVIQSILHKHKRYNEEKDALNGAIEYWKNFIQKINDFGDKTKWKNIIEIRYEDFIDDIQGTIKKVFEFCSVDVDNFNFDMVPDKLYSTNTKWINEKNKQKVKDIENKTVFFLKKYNYIK